MNRVVYPVEYDPLLRVFNNQLSFYQFLAQYNPEINVGLSALLPPTEFVIGSVHYPCRTIVDLSLIHISGERSTFNRKDDWADCVASAINFLEKEEVALPCMIPSISSPSMFKRFI